MARISFKNPNEPEQPAEGVYRWYCLVGQKEVTVYVGNAGGREKKVRSPSTLERGILEAQRNCLTSNQGESLDTDFIVGSALRYLKSKGYDCYWEHVFDDPGKESDFCKIYQPILQESGKIRSVFRIPKPDGGLWGHGDIELDVKEAERELFHLFANEFGEKF